MVRFNSGDFQCSFASVSSRHTTISCVFQMRKMEDISLYNMVYHTCCRNVGWP